MNEIYTIGHSNHETEYFLQLLRKHGINSVVDVRSVPFSKYVPQFNKDIIRRILNVNKIYCVYLGVELGIMQEDKNLFSPEGYLDFEKVRSSDNFTKGISRIETGINKGYNIAIMCAEKDPIDCHRSILITRVMSEKGYVVKHILPDGELELQEKLEERLLSLYNLELSQQSIFTAREESENPKELISLAYRARNKDLWKVLKSK